MNIRSRASREKFGTKCALGHNFRQRVGVMDALHHGLGPVWGSALKIVAWRAAPEPLAFPWRVAASVELGGGVAQPELPREPSGSCGLEEGQGPLLDLGVYGRSSATAWAVEADHNLDNASRIVAECSLRQITRSGSHGLDPLYINS